ncbi:MAG: polyprenyl synthetase family protein [Planctomycetaceae bacterium]|jgi:octaprenyl-diphosphate synthase|nr:polyprenyl synthetase family protein [Planctomycetaceae bacterium]
MQDVKDAYNIISEDLAAFDQMASKLISKVDPFVDDVVRYGLQLSGKRLRPALLFLTARGIGTITENHIRIAAAIELIHTATLIHDDILDGAFMRRHLTTINFKWDSHVAVLAGDILLTKAMELLTNADDIYGFKRITIACRQTCEGELLQIGTIGNFKISQKEYMKIIARKTSPFLACCTELGAHYAGASPEITEIFNNFGHQLGIAFQMIDDILDFTEQTNMTGKTLHTDIINRKPTAPLIRYLQKAPKKESDEILMMLKCNRSCNSKFSNNTTYNISNKKAELIVNRICRSGVIREIQQKAESIVERAIKSIANFPSGNTHAIKGLIAIARYITLRHS